MLDSRVVGSRVVQLEAVALKTATFERAPFAIGSVRLQIPALTRWSCGLAVSLARSLND